MPFEGLYYGNLLASYFFDASINKENPKYSHRFSLGLYESPAPRRGEGMFMFIVWKFLIGCWLGLYCASKHVYTILFCLNWTTETMQSRCCMLSAVYVVYHQWAWCCYSNSRASVPQLKTGSRLVGNSFRVSPLPDPTRLNSTPSWVGSGSGDGT